MLPRVNDVDAFPFGFTLRWLHIPWQTHALACEGTKKSWIDLYPLWIVDCKFV